MDIFATFATDETKEEDGVVHFLVPGKTDPATDPWIRVARIGNTAYSKRVTQVFEQLQAQKKAERLTDEQAEIRSKNLMIEVFAETLLTGFGNLTFQGAPMPAGKESHLQFMRVKDFREKVVGLANDVEHYKLKDLEAAQGN